jgi:hypothetical protein
MKNGFDRPVDRSAELGLGLCFQQNLYGGWGRWLKDAGRRLPKVGFADLDRSTPGYAARSR